MATDNEQKQHSAITLTFGEQAENHHGMQILGDGLLDTGFTLKDLRKAQRKFEEAGFVCEYYRLDKSQREEIKEEHNVDLERAAVLVVRNGVEALCEDADGLFAEQMGLEWDTRYFDTRRQRVLNKHARYNVCYGDDSQEANFEEGKGTVVTWDDLSLTKRLRDNLPNFLGEKARNLQGEGNLYYNPKKCGIGFHGDTERRLVIAARLGVTIPLHYQWYYDSQRIGDGMKLELHHGDVYAMSDKATGHDWKKRKIATLRHAAGCNKYTK
jgi:hypothetical protein